MKLTEKEFQDYLLQIRALAEGPFDEMQKEIEQLNDEINRISQSANFNGMTLFSGSLVTNGGGITLHVGETSQTYNQLKISLTLMNTSTIGGTAGTSMGAANVGTSSVANISITSAASARKAIDIVNNAIDQISSMRSTFGALQNRLEHTINNLGVQTENITSAESRIRDVDMAKEMMAYTKNNILVQASQAMLAQANQIPQGVLQLLQ